jgi:hypothetical protein
LVITSGALRQHHAAMNPGNPKKLWRWLKSKPSLPELRKAYPESWSWVEQELSACIQTEDRARLHRLLNPPELAAAETASRSKADILAAGIQQRMASQAVRHICLQGLAPETGGKFRFNLLDGWLAQRLLFERDFRRKPVDLFWFRLIWPLIRQKRYLMPLVERKGIYCFYSGALVEGLAGLIEARSCLEIAAGDGTLSRFLKARGVDIVATDDYSWSHRVDYSEGVVKADAREALRRYRPKVVICSWPPAGNDFERWVFKTPGVERYIVIGSELRFATGNWAEYQRQQSFSQRQDLRLSRAVLPPELGAAVYVFDRK